MNTTIKFIALILVGTLCFADTPPIIYQFAAPLVKTGGKNVSIPKSDATHDGYLDKNDWTTFNNKLGPSSGNYITNPTFEVDTSGWNLYNDQGNTTPATVTTQDITYTSTLSGGGGNGATVSYVLCGSSYVGPIVTCPTGTSVQVCWYNGPSLAQNPSATVLKAAFDAQSCATAIATATITGTASNRQYLTGTTATLAGGGDASPVDGTGGTATGVTFTRNTSTPLVGVASGDLGKDSSSEQGKGVSTDFTINSIDKNATLQISFQYSASSGMTLGTSSDVKVFVYDVGNSTLIPVTPKYLTGPVSTTKLFIGTFTATSSVNYRLILHIASSSATAWDLLVDSVTVNDSINASAATQVPAVVIQNQPISGAVTDHMVVMWRDGASQWVPATIAGAAIPVFGTDVTALGFATNIVGGTADIYVHGAMDGFSFGPFTGYNQYIDTTAGLISPLPSPFTSLFVPVGKAISSTVLDINFAPHINMISNSSGVPIKGGLLTSSGANDGTLDAVLSPGTNGQFLMANSGSANGIAWFSPVGTAPIVYTASTHAWSCTTATASVAGCLAAADFTTFNNKAPTASPAFTGVPTAPTAAANTNTTQIATTAFVTTADNLKANAASPAFTGTITSTGSMQFTAIGTGIQVKTGTNAKIGTATLSAGSATVANTSVTANSRIFVTSNNDGGTPGWLRVSAKSVGTSFTITSSSATDTSTVAWMIIESIP